MWWQPVEGRGARKHAVLLRRLGSRSHYVDRGVVNHGYPIAVHDVSFTSSGKRVDAMLVVPPGKGPFPAVVYLHGTGGDRTELLVPATWMAARGVVALTITMPELGTTTGTASQKDGRLALRDELLRCVPVASPARAS